MVYGPSEFYWGLLIALYPYITGMVAGAFIVSTLAHVFGKDKFKPVAKLGLIVAIVFMIVAALPLVADLGQPGKSYQIFTRLHPTSPMSMFGVILVSYLALSFVEGYFMFRESMIAKAKEVKGIPAKFYKLLTLGSNDTSKESFGRDEKIVTALGAIGLPMAALFHAYVGFIFGSVTARSLWTTPLTPIVFLVSAIASGTALLMIIAMIMWRYFSKTKTIRKDVIFGLSTLLVWTLVFDFAFNMLEIASRSYGGREEWIAIEYLMLGPLQWSYLGLQLTLGLAVPAVLLIIGRRSIPIIGIASVMVLVGVLAMRLNVVIGGQLIPRTTQAFIPLSATHHQFLADLAPTIGIFSLAGLLFALAVWILPWDTQMTGAVEK